MKSYDVVIVGGAVMGSATAYHLARLEPDLSVAVVEKDPSYEFSSTLRSDGNIRIQFNLEENIRISQYAMEVIETFPEDMAVGKYRPDPAPRHQGNLFLSDAAAEPEARAGMRLQRQLGCDVEWLDADEIYHRYPAYEGAGYLGGTFAQTDGSVDPNAVLHGYRRKAAAMGVSYIEAVVSRFARDGEGIAGVVLADGTALDSPVVVNAAGAWCRELAASIGVTLPVLPTMRTVHVVETRFGGGLPSVFLPNGLYLLPEAEGTFLIGWSQPDDPVGFDFEYRRGRFEEVVWPALAGAMPAFDSLRLKGGWTGLYEVNTLDGNAIVGEWPEVKGLFVANGFSGHGFQQCHAVGRHIAELILGRTPSLDLSRFGPERILSGEPYPESARRII